MLPRITSSLVAKYLAITAGYSLTRTIPRVWDATVEHKNRITNKFEIKPMLITHKLAACIVCTITGPWLWPVYATEDVTRLECYLRGKNPAEYGIE
jgi:hypothetical protein